MSDSTVEQGTDLVAGRCLLFVYGLLQPGFRPPASMSRSWCDRVRGLLYDLGEYPAAIAVGSGEGWISGHVLEISEAELVTELDEYEDVPGGRYRRIRTATASGHEVWIYEYAGEFPGAARGPFPKWPA